jgi:hypothetical protein
MKSGGVWRTGSGLVYKWSALQLATHLRLYRSQYCVAESTVNRYNISSYLLQQKKVWLAVHVMAYISANINLHINTVSAWNSWCDCIIYLKLPAIIFNDVCSSSEDMTSNRLWVCKLSTIQQLAPKRWNIYMYVCIYIYIYIQIWSEKWLWTIFYPLAPELNARYDVQKTGIKMTAAYGDH